jgi:predicted nucleic acid-binding protein
MQLAMDKVFLDTNVLLDYLAAREPFDHAAQMLIHRADAGEIELYVSVLSVCNIAYILRKLAPDTDIGQTLSELTSLAILTPIDDLIISDALQSPFTDFEDAVQYFSAVHFGGITHLLTRNVADFVHSQIPVCTPEQYLDDHPR